MAKNPVIIPKKNPVSVAPKPAPPAARVVSVSEEDDVQEEQPAPASAPSPQPQELKAPAPSVVDPLIDAVAKVEVRKENNDLVQVTVFSDIEPPPHIGKWKGSDELKVTKLVAKGTYKVPRFVANAMVDAKRAAILGE